MKIGITAVAALSCAAGALAIGQFQAFIDNEQAGTDSTVDGTLTGTFNDDTNTFSFAWKLSGDLSGDPASPGLHIHNGEPGVSGPIVFVISNGEWDTDGSAMWEDMTEDQVNSLFAGDYYINFHTTAFPSGEVRGQIFKIPAPGAAALFGLGGLAIARRRR